jgi:hypothetical protein
LLLCWLEEAYIRPQFLQAFRNDGKDPLSAIVQAFGAAAKSNAITMMNELSLEDRANVSAIVKGARKQYQQLLSYGTYAWETNPAASRLASRTASKAVSRAGSPDIFQGIMGQVPIRTKKGLKYGSDQGRPNVHTALHFEPMMEEYGSPAQSHVLIREDKHRGFKKAVYRTNHNNVTYELLRQESLQQTIRLILLNGFKDSDPVITQILGDLCDRCPALFEMPLTRAEQKSLWEPEDEDDLAIEADANHIRPTVTGCMPTRYCREQLGLPTRSSNTLLPRGSGSFLDRRTRIAIICQMSIISAVTRSSGPKSSRFLIGTSPPC